MGTAQPAGTQAPRTRNGTARLVRLAAALAVLALLVCAAWVALGLLARQDVLAGNDQDLIAAVSLAGLGFLVARRQPGNPIGWLMLAGAVGLALVNAAESYAMLAYRRGYHLSFGPAVLLLGYSWILPLAALATAILLFPDGHLPSPRWRWVLRMLGAAVACLLGSTYAVVLSTAFGHRVRLDASGGLAAVDDPSGPSAWLAAMEHLILPVIAACLLSFVIAQVLNWRRSSGERRQQLKWLLAGTVGFLFGGIVSLPVSALDPTPPVPAEAALTVLNALGFVALPACIAVAILKYRLYDIDRIISRTLAYAIVTGQLVGVYAGLVLLATRVLTFHTPVAVAVSTLAAAALFNPVRGRVQHAVDRRFNRARYDAGQTIAAFAARLQDAVDLDSVRDDLAGVVQQALEPAHISVWLSSAAAGAPADAQVTPQL